MPASIRCSTSATVPDAPQGSRHRAAIVESRAGQCRARLWRRHRLRSVRGLRLDVRPGSLGAVLFVARSEMNAIASTREWLDEGILAVRVMPWRAGRGVNQSQSFVCLGMECSSVVFQKPHEPQAIDPRGRGRLDNVDRALPGILGDQRIGADERCAPTCTPLETLQLLPR